LPPVDGEGQTSFQNAQLRRDADAHAPLRSPFILIDPDSARRAAQGPMWGDVDDPMEGTPRIMSRSVRTSGSGSEAGSVLETNMILTAKNAALAALLGVGLLAGGCSQTERSVAGGAALGAGAGALVGAVTDTSVAGGAVAGGVIGGVAGYCTAQRCFD
jgi:hypothetical protein